jgi:hypothetical protein
MIVREAQLAGKLLGSQIGRKYGVTPRSLQELQVACRNASEYGSDIVEYTFVNPSPQPQACVLYRGATGITPPYYFGNAFYAAYYGGISMDRGASYQQAAVFYDSTRIVAPMPEGPDGLGALAILDTQTPEKLVCFVFMVPPSGTLSVLEGGLNCGVLVDVHAYLVGIMETENFCVWYNQQAASQYQSQTGYLVKYPPDPFQVKSILMEALERNIPENQVLSDQYALEGAC